MAEHEYFALWEKQERDEFKKILSDPDECSIEDQREVTREVLKQFTAMFLDSHLAGRYRRLGLQLHGIEVLQARAAEIHHLKPSETRGMHLNDLLILLAGEIEHVSIPTEAAQVIRTKTADLPEWHEIDERLP